MRVFFLSFKPSLEASIAPTSVCLIYLAFFFNLLYFLSFSLFDCQFILNMAKPFIVLFYVFSNGFGKTKTSVQLNHLEKIIDRSITDGGDESY